MGESGIKKGKLQGQDDGTPLGFIEQNHPQKSTWQTSGGACAAELWDRRLHSIQWHPDITAKEW
jgi:hypothetical protein